MAVLPGPRGKDVDGGWAWLVLLASFLNLLVASGMGFVSGIFQKLFLEQFGQSVAFTAWVTALFSSFMQLAGPLSGALASVTNCRVTVMAGGGVLTVGLAASAFAPSLHWLLLTFGLLAGIGLGLMYSPSIVIVNFFFHRRRTVIMGLALSSAGIGIIVTPLLSRFLIDHFSWRETMLILASITAHCCVFGAVMFPIHEPPSPCLRRCRGVPADVDPAPCAERTILEDHHSLSSKDKGIPEPRRCSPKQDSGDEMLSADVGDGDARALGIHSGDALAAEAVVQNGCHPAPGTESETAIRMDIAEERTQLLGKAGGAETTTPKHTVKQTALSDKHRADFPPPPLQLAHLASQQGSRHSLSDIWPRASSKHWAVCQPHRGAALSHSAHSLHRSPQHGQRLLHTSARTPLTSGGWSTCRGSQGDLRSISIFSSIHSLHGGGLATVADWVASSHHLEEDEGEGGGGGGGWRTLLNVPFLFLCLNLFLSNMAISVFNIHLPAFAQQRGLDDLDISVVVASHGVGIFLARVLAGTLGHDDRVDKVTVYFGLYLIASLLQASLPWTRSVPAVTAVSTLIGLYYGGVYSLLTTLTISILGLPSLAFAFGVEMVCAGLGYLLAPPLAGWMVDVTGDYDKSMYLAALLMFLSALSVLCLTCPCQPGTRAVGYNPPPPSPPLCPPDTHPSCTDDHC